MRPKVHVVAVSMVATAVALLVAAACSTSTRPDIPQASPIRTLLEQMPDRSIDFLTAADYERAAADLGLARPAACATAAEAEPYVQALVFEGFRIDVSAPQFLSEVVRDPESLVEEFGIEFCDIRAFVEPGDVGVVLLDVDTDPADIDDAVRSRLFWSDLLRIDAIDDVEFYDWGDGLSAGFEGRSAARPIAEAGQLAVDGNVVIRTRDRDSLNSFVGNQNRNLYNRRDVAPVVDRLLAAGSHSIFLSEESFEFDPAALLITPPDEFDEEDLFAGQLVWWSLLGVGTSIDDRGNQLMTVVLAHATADDAQENAERFRRIIETAESAAFSRPWSDTLEIESITVEDKYMIAELRALEDRPPLRLAIASFLRRDNLFMVEPR